MRRLLISVFVIALLLSSFFILSSGSAATASGLLAATATPGVVTNPSNINLSGLGSPRVLAWNPNTKQLAWYASSGQPVALATASSNKALITTCGTNPAGDKMIIYQGGDVAQPFLYGVDGGAPLALGSNLGLACSIQGHTQFSPDGNHLAIIKYDNTSASGNYAYGTLRILKMPDGTEEHATDNTVAFDIQNDGAVALQFFANTKKEANAADLTFWDGSKERRVEQDIKADDNCQFVTGRVLRAGDKVYSLIGEKCKTGGSTWRLRRTDFAGGTAGTDIQTGKTGSNGAALYFSTADSNNMWMLPSGKDILFVTPNGMNSNVVDLQRISVGDNAATNTIMTSVIADTYPPTTPRFLLPNSKGDHLAFVTRDKSGGQKLYLYDLTAPDSQPVAIAGGHAADQITGLAWTADGSRLFYAIVGEDNGVLSVDTKGASSRVERGSFLGLAVSPDGAYLATAAQNQVAAKDIRYNLVQIKTDDGSTTTIVEGAKGEQPITPLIVR